MSQMLLGFGKRTAESPCLLNPPVKFSKPMTTSRASTKRGVGAEGVELRRVHDVRALLSGF